MSTEKQELLSYLDEVWADEAQTFITVKVDDDIYKVLPIKSWGASKEKVVVRILALVAQGHHVYYSPANYLPESPTKEKVYVRGSKVLWADFDGNAKTVWENYPSELPKPSWKIQTGADGHEHWYWLLDKEYSVSEFEKVSQRLTYFLDADKACWSIEHVMRPIHTRNFKAKYLKPPYSMSDFPYVSMIEKNSNRYSLEEFDKVLPAVRAMQTKGIESLKELGKLPSVAEVLARYHWDEEHTDLFLNRTAKDLVNSKGESQRDEALFRLAMYSAEQGMSDAAIYVVVDSFAQRTGKFEGRRDREAQLLKFVEKSRAKHPQATVSNLYSEDDLKTVFTFAELLASEVEIDWLIEDFIPRGTINFVSAMSGIGKSRLTMQLAYACASGSKFLTWDIARPMKAMYVSLEMDTPMLKHFATGLAEGKELTDLVSDNLLMVPIGEAVSLADTEFFENLIKEYEPDVMFIDALGSLTLEAIDEKNAKDINNKLKSLINKYRTTFVVIHHNRKDGQNAKDEPTLHSIYGSQYIVTDAAVVLTMHRINEEKIKLIPVKTRAVKKPIHYVVMDGSKGFEFEVADDESESDLFGGTRESKLEDIGNGAFFN